MALWMYNKDGAKLFNCVEDVPKGYQDTPVNSGVTEKPAKKTKDNVQDLRDQLDERGIKYHHMAGEAKLKALLEG